jgi:hypothetical protein
MSRYPKAVAEQAAAAAAIEESIVGSQPPAAPAEDAPPAPAPSTVDDQPPAPQPSDHDALLEQRYRTLQGIHSSLKRKLDDALEVNTRLQQQLEGINASAPSRDELSRAAQEAAAAVATCPAPEPTDTPKTRRPRKSTEAPEAVPGNLGIANDLGAE